MSSINTQLLPNLSLRDGKPVLQIIGSTQNYKLESGLAKDGQSNVEQARERVRELGGNVDNILHVLGQEKIQFGQYQGRRFLWVMENALGYFANLAVEAERELQGTLPKEKCCNIRANKNQLLQYCKSFELGREAMKMKRKEKAPNIVQARSGKTLPSKGLQPPSTSSQPQASSASTTKPKASSQPSASTTKPKATSSQPSASTTKPKATSSQPSASTTKPKATSSQPDSPRTRQAKKVPVTSTVTSATVLASTSGAGTASSEVPVVDLDVEVATGPPAFSDDDPSMLPLPAAWRKGINPVDHSWISKALFRWKNGKPELKEECSRNLWYHPPEPAPRVGRPPSKDPYFASKLLLWMPKRRWGCLFRCPQKACKSRELTSAGLYKTIRKVLDVDQFYYMGGEYLECPSCHGKLCSWTLPLLAQLDQSHRMQFPVILTYRKACDIKVVRKLRLRSLGNSPTAWIKTLHEEHAERYLQQVGFYLERWRSFQVASVRGLVTIEAPSDPPSMEPVPTPKWLLAVYVQDILERLDDVKASITSVFGSILKMDSTKKITKKLAGKAAHTASWATNVGNEYGQVLMSVLTTHEGGGLEGMIQGLQDRYTTASVDPPVLIYVDRDCCGEKMRQMIHAHWPNTAVRLDIWHFMRRIATAVNTESHQLYSSFMGRLSHAIFAWDEADHKALLTAKQAQLIQGGFLEATRWDAQQAISRKELALHCRRGTRGVEETKRLIEELLTVYTSEQGKDSLGTPLLNSDLAWQTWEEQKRHIPCLQDPPAVSLYTQTGTIKKGGHELRTFRCARGSTSLESFHLHLNRFIPGESANYTNFQAYLLEGLHRWNRDREVENVQEAGPRLKTYSGRLQQHIHKLSQDVLGHSLLPYFKPPQKYTGERIGVEYLLHQSSATAMQSIRVELDPVQHQRDDLPVRQQSAGLEEEANDDDEGFSEVEEDVDLTVYQIPDLQEALPSQAGDASPSASEEPMEQPAAGSSTDDLAEFLGPDGVPGYQHVVCLANRLALMRTRLTLSTSDADSIISGYRKLSEYDKQPITMEERVSPHVRGRFKAKGPSSLKPGVLATKRSFLGSNQGPAQKVDSSRLLEAVVKQLTALHPTDIMEQGRRTTRWALILRDYGHIRGMVLDCPRVMEATRLQLPDINQTTLRNWFNERVKRQERQVLELGLPYAPPPVTASQALPPAKPLPATLDAGSAEDRHDYHLPPSTAGTAGRAYRRQKDREYTAVPISSSVLAATQQPAPPLPPGVPGPQTTYIVIPPTVPGNPHLLQPMLLPPSATATATSTSSADPPVAFASCPNVARSTSWYRRKRELQKQQDPQQVIYKRHKLETTCRQCGRDRSAHPHRQYFGKWWCEASSPLSYEEWKADQQQNRQIKKREKRAKTPSDSDE